MGAKELMAAAAQARKNAYAPYSHYCVGAALVTEDGSVFTGCNIESVALTPTICAERTALAKAISSGHRRVTEIAVVGGKEELSPICPPCGVCRQLLAEFCSPQTKVYLGTPQEFQTFAFGELLPNSFTGDL